MKTHMAITAANCTDYNRIQQLLIIPKINTTKLRF